MRRASLLLLSLTIVTSVAQAKHAAPQPFLLFYVHYLRVPGGYLVGTLSEKIHFETSEMSRDRLDSIWMHAEFIERTPGGFRFSWQLVQRVQGKVSTNIVRGEFVAWGARKRVASIPDCTVDVLYSPVPANDLKPF
jgi:hypothetical protein